MGLNLLLQYYSLVFPVRNLSSARVDSESAATAAKADVNVAGLNSLEKLLAVTEATDGACFAALRERFRCRSFDNVWHPPPKSLFWSCAAFKDFLAGEFSVENLMFYLGASDSQIIDPISRFLPPFESQFESQSALRSESQFAPLNLLLLLWFSFVLSRSGAPVLRVGPPALGGHEHLRDLRRLGQQPRGND